MSVLEEIHKSTLYLGLIFTSLFPYLAICNRAGLTPFFHACSGGDVHMMEELRSIGANINILNNNGYHPIHGAVDNNHRGVINRLLELNVDINCSWQAGMTPLHYSIVLNNQHALSIASFLLDHKADPNIPSKSGYYPIHSAIYLCSLELVRLLIEKKADINSAATEKVTPLYYAMGYGSQPISTEILDYLLENRADPNTPMNDGDTPMHMAAYKARFDIMEKLLSYGAIINTCNHAGETPLYVCIKQDGLANEQKLQAVKYLISRGAAVDDATYELATKVLPESVESLSSTLQGETASGSLVDDALRINTATEIATEGKVNKEDQPASSMQNESSAGNSKNSDGENLIANLAFGSENQVEADYVDVINLSGDHGSFH